MNIRTFIDIQTPEENLAEIDSYLKIPAGSFDTNFDEKNYHRCVYNATQYSEIQFSVIDPERQWKVHTCFKECKEANEDKAFISDNRPLCDKDKK